MAAIYSGIHLKLKSPQTPWEDKLKLARFAWVSPQCVLPNKEQVVLDWCTHALTGRYNQKVEFSQSVLERLWCFLDDLLHSRKLHSLLKQGKTITPRLNMAQLLLDRLQECAGVGSESPVCVSTILSVCQGLLSSPLLSSIFTTKYELIVDLVSKLCSLACRQLQQLTEPQTTVQDEAMTECPPNGNLDDSQIEPPASPPKVKENLRTADLFEVLLQALSCYLSVQRQQANPNRVFTMVTNQLIQPVVVLRHLLTSGDSAAPHAPPRLRQQLSRDIRVKLDSILQSALFPSEHLTSYKEELLPAKEDSGKRGPGGAKGPLKPVSAILSKLSSQGYAVKSNTMPLMFKFFLESYGKGRGDSEEAHRMLCFYFMTKLAPALDVNLEGQVSVSPESWSLTLLALESLLSQALSADIYNVAADRIRHGEVQLKFYRALGLMLFTQAQPSIPAWYRCLKVLLSLNHLILEPDLDQLLSSAWVHSECMEARVQRARQLMVCSLLQIYTKLRQLPRLFSELLSVICKPVDQLRPPLLSEGISASLRTCLVDTPSSQGLEICSLVLASIRGSTLGTEEHEEMEIDGGGDASLRLSSLSNLLHVVLFSLKTLDGASPLLTVRQSQSLMAEMQQVVEELLKLSEKANTRSAKRTPGKGKKKPAHKDQEGAERTQEAALLLQYTWVEVDTLFNIHCSKYKSVDPAQAPVLTRMESLLSGEVSSSRPMNRLLLKLLTLQQMKKLLFDTTSPSEATTALLNRAAQFILAKSEFKVDTEQIWDGQITSVDAGSDLVAHWHLIMSNLPLLVPYLSGEDVHSVADILVGSLLRRKDPPLGCLSVSLVSSQLLQSPIFAELPSLFSAVVCSLTQRIMSVLRETRAPPAFLKLQDGDAAPQKETIVEDILESSKTGETSVSLTDAQNKQLLDLLEILTTLNPDGMNSEDLSSVFLLLVFTLTSTSTQSGDDAVFLETLLGILTRLLEGRNFQSVLKLIHGGSLLQAAVSSLLRRSSSGGFKSSSSSNWSALIKTTQGFIGSLVQLIIVRNSSVRLNLEQFVSYLTSEEMKNTHSSADPGVLSVHLLLASLTSLSQIMTQNFGRSKQMDQTLTQMLTRTTASLRPAVEAVLKPQNVGSSSVLGQAFVVEVVTVMLQCELASMSVDTHLTLSHMTLYRRFCQQILREMSGAQRPLDFLVASLYFLSAFYRAVERTGGEETGGDELEKLYVQILQSVHRLLTASWLSADDVCELESPTQELLRHLVEKTTTGRFNLLLLLIIEGLDTGKLRAGSYREVLSAVLMVKLLSCCPLPETCSKALWLMAPQIISAMVFLVKSSTQDSSLIVPFTIPTVTAMTSLLRQGEGLMGNPHHVILVLGALQAVTLDHLTPPVYQSVFLAVHEALFAIIQCHPQVMSNAAPSFLNVFYRLVASIMQEGRQRGDNDKDAEVYIQCSRLIERMYSHIAASAESFTTLSSFMVAQYVTELQKVTLRPEVKSPLTEGIYRILDLCLEQDMKFVTCGLPLGVREVFSDLHSSYTHYHKAQRQGEEKYTV